MLPAGQRFMFVERGTGKIKPLKAVYGQSISQRACALTRASDCSGICSAASRRSKLERKARFSPAAYAAGENAPKF
jgi:hypothetical protein